jgi:hypothetical protein
LPLWQLSTPIDGTGQTIAIVAESNINVQDVQDFRNVFGLPANNPQIIVDGVDPGVTANGLETEADLDVEWAGAVAKNATIDLVVSESTESTAGVDLSAVYIVDNNLAPVLSESFGACEAFLGAGGNAFHNSIWEQGAAQGITILVASGDSGSAVCDRDETAAQYGLAVSGAASTWFNVAVGGTDFNDVNTWSAYWSATNNSTTLSSALSYIPEMTWNDSCARFGVASDCASAASATPTGIDLVAGSGGASNCINPTGTYPNLTCTGGYAKPAWQSGTGVPQDGARDLPDVSLFASDGFLTRSFYVLCEADALPAGYVSCNEAYSTWYFLGVGGTSASAPTFAGIMALVNEKTGERQGIANYVLYPLAAKTGSSCTSNATMASTANSSSCIFYDVVTGNNSVACVGGSPNCSNTNTASGNYGILEVNPPTNPLPAWTTGAGYDLATGLGSVNAMNLVDKWTSVSFTATTTALSLSTTPPTSPVTLTHGTPVSFTINVAPKSGSGTPTGDVSLIAQAGTPPSNVTGIGSFTLSSGSSSGTTDMLPGGSYGVTAHYAGDGTYGASDSTPAVPVTVSAEGSQTRVALLTFNPTTGQETSSNATSLTYGSSFEILRADVTNSSGQLCFSSSYPCPTGQVTLTDNAPTLTLGTYNLNSQGYTEDQFIQLGGGTNNVVASYSGDSSYNISTSPTDAITITLAPTTTTLSGLPSSVVAMSTVSGMLTVNTQSVGAAPSAAVQLLLNGNTPHPIGGDVERFNGSATAPASLEMTFYTNLPAGQWSVAGQFLGDSNYVASGSSPPVTVNVTDFSVSANPSTINISTPGQSGTSTVTVTPLYGFTGTVILSCEAPSSSGLSCTVSPATLNVTGASAVTATVAVTTTAATPPAPQQMAPHGGLRENLPTLSLRGVAPDAESLRSIASRVRCLPFARLWVRMTAAGSFPFRSASLRPPAAWHCLLPWLLAVATLMSLAIARRRPAGLLFAAALLVVGVWVACGGGGGGNPAPPPAPNVTFSPSSLTFGSQVPGSSSAFLSTLMSNTGNAALSISSIAIGGANPGDFAQTNDCLSTLPAGANCTFDVTFTPTAVGPRSASLAVTDNASGSPQTVSLTGTGISGPLVSLSPASLTFSQENVGTTSGAESVTLSNTGNASLSISGIAIGGANPGDFAQTSTCGTSVAAGANCTISVTFTPTAVGTRTASLAVTDNATGSPHMVGLTGTGVVPTPPGTYSVLLQIESYPDVHFSGVSVIVQ